MGPLRLHEVTGRVPNPMGLVCLEEEETAGMDAQRRGHSEEAPAARRGETSPETHAAGTLLWGFQPPEPRERTARCLSCPVGIVWQPKQTKQ